MTTVDTSDVTGERATENPRYIAAITLHELAKKVDKKVYVDEEADLKYFKLILNQK